MKTLSGSILILAGAIVFGTAKIAKAIALTAGHEDTPVSMLVIGSTFSLGGVVVLVWGLFENSGLGSNDSHRGTHDKRIRNPVEGRTSCETHRRGRIARRVHGDQA